MKKDVAIIMTSTCFRCAREMSDLLEIARNNCEPEEYKKIRMAIGSIMYDMMENIVAFSLKDNLELKECIDTRIKEIGRAF